MEQNQTTDEIEINLSEIFMSLWSKKWMILLSGIFCALVVGIVSQFMIPNKYQSSTKVYVVNRQESNSLTMSDLQMGSQLTKDYKEVVLSRFVLERVSTELELDMSYGEMLDTVAVSISQDTRILVITVTNSDPYKAREIAEAVRTVAAEHISSVMNIEAVNVVEAANLPTSPSSPSVKKNTLLGGVVGLFIAILIILIIFILDDTLRSTEDVEKYLGLTVLGIVPTNEKFKGGKKKNKRKQVVHDKKEVGEE